MSCGEENIVLSQNVFSNVLSNTWHPNMFYFKFKSIPSLQVSWSYHHFSITKMRCSCPGRIHLGWTWHGQPYLSVLKCTISHFIHRMDPVSVEYSKAIVFGCLWKNVGYLQWTAGESQCIASLTDCKGYWGSMRMSFYFSWKNTSSPFQTCFKHVSSNIQFMPTKNHQR